MSTESEEASDRSEVIVAVLLALVALTAALAAWRTNVVGSNAAESTRLGQLDTVKLQAFANLNQSMAYQEAGYAAQAASEAAGAEAMKASELASLRAAGATVAQYAVPNLEKLAGPFPGGELVTDLGTLDIDARVAQLAAEDDPSVDPEAKFARATSYSDEKQWLTVVSVILAIALFWLGLAEISSGRWRWTNTMIGIAVWAIGLGGFAAVELYALGTRGGSL